ncbi:MAG: polyribonucleotide nucleotidyltransferase [Acidobacteria bacterium]|nr:polyribonucleotide nucleotidyltransferase [Acidobacteriota bacterium]MBI3655420.1 polyribonucleotide nucleotidyltransferase [Acidobacteriota bacterium]
MIEKTSVVIGNKELTIEVGRVAKQADGAVYLRYGDTVVLVTACAADKPREGIDFMPLTVDYREYTYAAGKIPGGFFKREGRLTEKEVLTCRVIDRPLRPLFPEDYHCETQVMALVLSADVENNPDIMSITGASMALYLSNIPFTTPIAGVRVGLINGQLVVNPTLTEIKTSDLNLVVAGSEEAIVMVEAGANQVSEEIIIEALLFAHENIKKIVAVQKELYSRLNVTKRPVIKQEFDTEFYGQVERLITNPIREALRIKGKLASYKRLDEIKDGLIESIPKEQEERREDAEKIFKQVMERVFRHDVLDERLRPDMRAFDEIRRIECEVGFLPRTHGSALFTRGETQALVTTTLGTAEDAQRLDTLEGDSSKRFMLHYNFPPFSVGETGIQRAPGRREVGHGALAERALAIVLPAENEFPYTIRIVSDILESNGSSSMATVCGGTLSLMDAGVPIKKPVAGVAMGLIKEGDKYSILTDIAGAEDHYGDMDFKVAGTDTGITALQMDIKTSGVTREILAEALAQAKRGRLFILEKMMAVLSESRKELSPYAPRIITIMIPTSKIGEVIGSGGKTIRGIIEQTGVKIDINDDGSVNIASTDDAAAQKAIKIIQGLVEEPIVGKIYKGRVTRIAEFGAFVEIIPNQEGLLHVSEIAEYRVKNVRDELKENDEVMVKVLEVNQGKTRLSRRAVLREQRVAAGEPPPEGAVESGSRDGSRPEGEGRGNFRRDRDSRGGPRGDNRSSGRRF